MTTAPAIHRLRQLSAGTVQPLPADGRHDASFHQWSQPEIDALTLALAARRPLLVRGEPGTGKTQLARAAACQLGWHLHPATVTPGMEPQDLVFRFDAIKRLADAHAAVRKDSPLDEHSYYEPGPLWKAFGWQQALGYGSLKPGLTEPEGHVVLIDEIDKSDSDLPNSLLEVLGQRSFSIPALGLEFSAGTGPLPLVLITTNEERELPAAFVRRCIVLNLAPGSAESYEDWLVQRGLAHFGPASQRGVPDQLDEATVLRPAARRLADDRAAAQVARLPPPGLAEYLDLLYALHALTQPVSAAERGAEQQRWLHQLSGYAYLKYPAPDESEGLKQSRPFDGPAVA